MVFFFKFTGELIWLTKKREICEYLMCKVSSLLFIHHPVHCFILCFCSLLLWCIKQKNYNNCLIVWFFVVVLIIFVISDHCVY